MCLSSATSGIPPFPRTRGQSSAGKDDLWKAPRDLVQQHPKRKHEASIIQMRSVVTDHLRHDCMEADREDMPVSSELECKEPRSDHKKDDPRGAQAPNGDV